jgi:GR25 family glycosyltransferase involved in LPS biosynthesis
LQIRSFILGVAEHYRGETLEKQLHSFGIPFEHVQGQDGRGQDPNSFKNYSSAATRILMGRDMTGGEIATVQGHQLMISRFVESEAPWGLLLEDDCSLTASPRELLPILETMRQSRLLVQLEQRSEPSHSQRQRKRIDTPIGYLIRLLRPKTGAAAYLMSRQAAIVARDTYAKRSIDSVADWPVGWARKIDFWVLDPPCAVHDPEQIGHSLLSTDRDFLMKQLDQEPARGKYRTLAQIRSLIYRYSGLVLLHGAVLGLPIGDTFHKACAEPLRYRLKLWK